MKPSQNSSKNPPSITSEEGVSLCPAPLTSASAMQNTISFIFKLFYINILDRLLSSLPISGWRSVLQSEASSLYFDFGDITFTFESISCSTGSSSMSSNSRITHDISSITTSSSSTIRNHLKRASSHNSYAIQEFLTVICYLLSSFSKFLLQE